MSLSKPFEGPYRKEGHPRSDYLRNKTIFHELKIRIRELDAVEPFEKREKEDILRILQSYSFHTFLNKLLSPKTFRPQSFVV
jgi:hypothetical protein